MKWLFCKDQIVDDVLHSDARIAGAIPQVINEGNGIAMSATTVIYLLLSAIYLGLFFFIG